MRTLYVAELQGNSGLWRELVSQEAQKADRVVQLGNFLGMGQSMAARNKTLLKLVNAYRYTQEDWLQIAGPNELVALNYPEKITDAEGDAILRRLWFATETNEPSMLTAGVDKGRLVSHGGLTHGLWLQLGKPTSAAEAAAAINERYANSNFQGTAWKLGHRPNFAANPIWADPLRETYPSWITAEESCPFGQIHGASNLNSGVGLELRDEPNGYLRWLEEVRQKSYGSILRIGGSQFIGLTLGLPPITTKKLPEKYSLYFEEETS